MEDRQHTVLRSLGLGLITGAADDDCSAIGTYAQAGAQLGYGILWTAPVTFPIASQFLHSMQGESVYVLCHASCVSAARPVPVFACAWFGVGMRIPGD